MTIVLLFVGSLFSSSAILSDNTGLQSNFSSALLASNSPKRLVLIRNKLLHQIKKVELCAGSHVRCSVTGFFMSNKKIADIKERTK